MSRKLLLVLGVGVLGSAGWAFAQEGPRRVPRRVIVPQETPPPEPVPPQQDVAPPVGQQVPPEEYEDEPPPDTGYYDEPPLDYYQRQWRWYTRHTRPQRFSNRDRRHKYGYNPPFAPWVYPHGGYFGPLGTPGYGFWGDYSGDLGGAYIQGRHDERRFRDWKERHDKGERSYVAAMEDGVATFRDGDYSAAARAFLRAAELNQGDPASRLHATYALVALGNFEEAAKTLRKAMELQSRLFYLPLEIRGEYGRPGDFEVHFRRLHEAAAAGEDPDVLALLAFYAYFSGNSSLALDAVDDALDMNPDDRVLPEFRRIIQATRPREVP